MESQLITPRGEPPIPGRAEVETETMNLLSRKEVEQDGEREK